MDPSSDFASINLQYLIALRELSLKQPALASVISGVPEEVIRIIATLEPKTLLDVASQKRPLVEIRGDTWWWSRLTRAMRDGTPDEILDVLEQNPLLLAAPDDHG